MTRVDFVCYVSQLSRVCTVVHYAVLEAISYAYAIMENSTPCKYKTVKDIEKPFGIYHYVAESSCCAKFYRNCITHLGGQIGEVLVFFLLTNTQRDRQTDRQTDKFFHLAYRL